LSHYQTLCEDLDIYPIPETITACKTALKAVYVNIVDLVQYRRERRNGTINETVRRFGSLEQLKDYSSQNQKWYPKATAKAEMLRVLLKILD
jgi:hypothetical protein